MARCKKSEKPWERQPKESAKAFEAFEIYCQMGNERSIRKVAQKLLKSDCLLRRWSSQWGWQERARAYDNELKRLELIEAKKGFRDMQKRQMQMGMLMQKKALQALDQMSPDELPSRDIIRLMTEGAKLERETRQLQDVMTQDEDRPQQLADIITEAWQKRNGE